MELISTIELHYNSSNDSSSCLNEIIYSCKTYCTYFKFTYFHFLLESLGLINKQNYIHALIGEND